jgi:putative ABC transport system permease protein
MRIFKLIFRNAGRHKLRTFLTILGMGIAVMAFTVIRTTIDAWYAGAEAASPNRLITRHAVSLTFFLPLSYADRLARVDGVEKVSHASWFGGVYVDPKNFFAQFSVDHKSYFDMYPEFLIPEEQRQRFNQERNGAIVGRRLADRFGWSVGDPIRLTGTIFPGDWDFVIVGIYTGAKENTDESAFFFRWDYLDERLRRESPIRSGYVGTFAIQITDPERSAEMSQAIDREFRNSTYETKTETEEAFNLSFVSMANTIVLGLKVISFMVVGIIMLVLGNTMAMTARERIAEYAVMKTLGFKTYHIVGLILGESLFIAALGGVAGILLTWPVGNLVKTALSAFFPTFSTNPFTLVMAGAAAMIVGLLAAIFPALKALRTPIVEGLRIID